MLCLQLEAVGYEKGMVIKMKEICFAVGDKKVSLYGFGYKGAPIVYLNTVHDEGAAVWEACRGLGCREFTLAAISNLRWHHDMSPWAIPPISPSDTACSGGADEYLELLTGMIMPQVEGRLLEKPAYHALAGYSLGGLFAIYASYRTDAFSRFASASGSFWFPDITEYVREHHMTAKPKKIYFSIGDKEGRTGNKLLQTVEERTKQLAELYAREGINTLFIRNPGNHFKEPIVRMAKGICWILEEN